jgi:uncharacterized protein (TIGR03067 family)
MRKLLLTAALFGGVALLTSASGAQEKDKLAVEAPKLDGGYTIVSGEEDGKAVPAERIKGATVRFNGDTITGTDKDKKELFAAKFTVETDKKPWVIRMRSTAPKAADASGLIKKEGDTVTIVYALPGGEAPKEFKTKEGQQLFVLKNTNRGDKAKEPIKP